MKSIFANHTVRIFYEYPNEYLFNHMEVMTMQLTVYHGAQIPLYIPKIPYSSIRLQHDAKNGYHAHMSSKINIFSYRLLSS